MDPKMKELKIGLQRCLPFMKEKIKRFFVQKRAQFMEKRALDKRLKEG